MLQTIIFLISEVVQIYVIYLLVRCFFSKCYFTGVGEFFVYVGAYFTMTIPYLLIGIPVVTILFSVCGIVVVTFAYESNWKKRILASVFTYGIFVVVEVFVALLFGYIKFDFFQRAEYFSIFGTICLPLIRLLVVLIIRNFVHIREGEEISGIYWAVSIMLPILSVYLQIVFYSQSEIQPWQTISCAVVLFLLNLLVFYLFDRQSEGLRIKHEKENLEVQNEYQQKQMNLMNRSVEISNRQKHDFLKHVSMISYLTRQKKEEQLLEYLNKIQDFVENQETYVDTGNLMLDAIVNIKMQELLLNEVDIHTHVAVPNNLSISAYDLNIILSNLLDNCKEAVEKLDDKHVFLNIEYSKSRLFIETENAYENICFDRERILTTKEDKENHGYGIQNVKEAVKRYGGTIELKEKNGKFRVGICIFL